MTHQTNAIRLSTGVTVPYVERGDPDGLPLVLLHGYSDSLRSFDLLMPHLPGSIRAIAFSQRGHGDADRPAGGYGPEVHAADLRAFLDGLGIEAAVILGHSGGGYIAQRFAVDHPERTLGVVLVCAFRSFNDNPDVLELHEEVVRLTDPVDPAFVRAFQEGCVAEPVPPAFLEAMIAESRKLPARVWRSYLGAFIAADVPTESGTIAAPTLLVWGDRDAFITRAEQEALRDAIPGAELVVYAGTGHCPHWERPQTAAADVAAFAARVQEAEPAPAMA